MVDGCPDGRVTAWRRRLAGAVGVLCRSTRSLDGDRRATSPVVGKLLELGLVALFVGSLSTVLLGGVVPAYQTQAGAELGERVLADASRQVEAAVPPNATAVETTRRVELPATIDGESYEIRASGRTLVLTHRNEAITTRTRLVLPPRVVRVSGAWQSGGEAVVRVTSGPSGLTVELTAEGAG